MIDTGLFSTDINGCIVDCMPGFIFGFAIGIAFICLIAWIGLKTELKK